MSLKNQIVVLYSLQKRFTSNSQIKHCILWIETFCHMKFIDNQNDFDTKLKYGPDILMILHEYQMFKIMDKHKKEYCKSIDEQKIYWWNR